MFTGILCCKPLFFLYLCEQLMHYICCQDRGAGIKRHGNRAPGDAILRRGAAACDGTGARAIEHDRGPRLGRGHCRGAVPDPGAGGRANAHALQHPHHGVPARRGGVRDRHQPALLAPGIAPGRCLRRFFHVPRQRAGSTGQHQRARARRRGCPPARGSGRRAAARVAATRLCPARLAGAARRQQRLRGASESRHRERRRAVWCPAGARITRVRASTRTARTRRGRPTRRHWSRR